MSDEKRLSLAAQEWIGRATADETIAAVSRKLGRLVASYVSKIDADRERRRLGHDFYVRVGYRGRFEVRERPADA